MGCSPGSRSSSKVHSPRLTVPVPSIVCAKFTPGNTPEGTVPHPTRESSSSGRNGKERWAEGRVAGLERKIGQQAMEIDLFERVLAAHRGTADAAGVDWKSAVYRKVKEEMNADRGLTVERMMQLGGVRRARFYRFDENAHQSHDADMDLRDAVQRIALEWP